jgi:hypothetical protein
MSPIRMSKLEAAMRVVLAFNEAFNRHDVPGMMQLMSDKGGRLGLGNSHREITRNISIRFTLLPATTIRPMIQRVAS